LSPKFEYDDVPLRPFHRRLALCCSVGVFSDGYGLGIIGIALAQATEVLKLNALWMGLLGGASLFGLFGGALLTGPLADRIGRRPIFAYNMALLAAFSALQFAAPNAPTLLALRLLVGFLLGTDFVVSKALLTELSPRAERGRLVGSLSIAWAGGYTCAYFIGYAMSALGPGAWRWMLLTSALPCVLVLPLRLRMPESPMWLSNRGLTQKAEGIVARHLGSDVRPPQRRDAAARGSRWLDLFSSRWRRRTLVGCAFLTCQVIPYYAVGTFISQILAALHMRAAYAGGLIYNGALLGGAIGGFLIVNRITRRTFLLGSFLITAGAMLALFLWTSVPAILMALLFAVFAGVLSSASNLVYVYLPELFPTELRASGIGLSIACSRVGSAIGTFLLPVVVEQYSVRAALAACVAVLVLGALICWRFAPETREMRLTSFDQSAAA
jgi:MFS transporter, putative metabolite transport protein